MNMHRCLCCPTFTTHSSLLCSKCRAAAEAGPEQNTYGITAACQQEPDECQFCDNKVPCGDLVCSDCYAKGCRSSVSKRNGGLAEVTTCWVLPKDNCLPATAKAILDLDRKPLTEKQQAQAEGVARAVQNLSQHNAIIRSYRRNHNGN